MSKLDRLMAEVGGNVDESTDGPARRVVAHSAAPSASPRMVGVGRSKDTALIDLDRIVPDPDQPRKEFAEGEMEEMVSSLREHGQLQPIRVRWDDGLGKYKILMGERRYRASISAGLASISAVIHEGPLSASEALEIQLVENLARADLRPIELATAIRRLIDEHGMTQLDVARKLGMTQSSVSDSLSLLKLDPEVRSKVDAGVISAHAARSIARVETPEAQREVADLVERSGLTGSETAEVVRRAGPGKGRGGKKPAKTPRPWKFRAPNGARVTVEYARGQDSTAGEAALAEALARFRGEHAASDAA